MQNADIANLFVLFLWQLYLKSILNLVNAPAVLLNKWTAKS